MSIDLDEDLWDSGQEWILIFDNLLKHPRGRGRGCKCDMCLLDKVWKKEQVRQCLGFVQLIFYPGWSTNQLHKNPNIAQLVPFCTLKNIDASSEVDDRHQLARSRSGFHEETLFNSLGRNKEAWGGW